jgi:hypothetical protein
LGIATDEKSKEEITSLHNGIKSLQSGNNFSNQIFVYDDKHARIPVNRLNSKRGKTIFYFWTSKQKRHKRLITKRIKGIAKKYPNINIVGICLDTDHKSWKRTIKDPEFANSKQYRIGKREDVLKDFALISINKLIITDRSGNFINAFADIYDQDLYAQLK